MSRYGASFSAKLLGIIMIVAMLIGLPLCLIFGEIGLYISACGLVGCILLSFVEMWRQNRPDQ